MSAKLRIALIGSARYAIGEPFAGGLEAHTWTLARALRRRGHQVTIFASSGCDPALDVQQMPTRWPRFSDAARADVSMAPDAWLGEHHAYLTLMLQLSRGTGFDGTAFDVVHNNSLHYLPVAMAAALPVSMITTLHTPPTPWLESAIQTGPCPVTFVAVSQHTARAWRHAVQARVILNGVDLERWRPGPGGDGAIWFGRVVPEKGPDLAIQAARLAGIPLDLVGPVSDRSFFAERIAPELAADVRYLGHLEHRELAARVAHAAVSLVTPRWDEPYGLVAAESLACGTPVAGFERGGLTEVLDPCCSELVAPDDVAALATAITRARRMSRPAARAHAQKHCSMDRMVGEYEALYHRLSPHGAAA